MLALTAACGHAAAAGPPVTRHVVLVTARDDHGLLVDRQVVLVAAPGDAQVTGVLPSGTLADVRQVRGTQVLVSARGATGWVDDFSLRSDLRLTGPPPSCAVQVAGRSLAAGTRVEVLRLNAGQALVRLSEGRASGWVPQAAVTDLAPAPGHRCPDLTSGRSDG